MTKKTKNTATTATARHANARSTDQFLRLDLPYFVYGTLRPGHGNARLWMNLDATASHDGDAEVRGYELFVSGIPFAVKSENYDARVIGTLIHPPDDPELQRLLRRDLDSLEGWPVGYTRVPVAVFTVDDWHLAWMYTPANWPAWRGNNYKVPASGDYNHLT